LAVTGQLPASPLESLAAWMFVISGPLLLAVYRGYICEDGPPA
jgi:hypothetical protein